MTKQTLALINLTSHQDTLDKNLLKTYGIELVEKEGEGLALSAYLILKDDPRLEEILVKCKSQQAPCFIFSDEDDEKNVLGPLENNEITHIVGKSPYLTDEIAQNTLKHFKKNIWGLEKYLQEDALLLSKEILHSKDTNEAIQELLDEVDFTPFFESPKDYLKVIANELLSNAFYHMEDSPTHDRKESIFVSASDSVTLKLGIDKQKVAISVKDGAGQLTRQQVVKSLTRGFREKKPKNNTPGAGLGLYLVFHHSNQLIFNCSQERGSEIIAIIDVNKRYLNYKKRVTSLHFFQEDEI